MLDRLHKAFHRKRSGLLSKGVLLLPDRIRPRLHSDLKQRFQWNIWEHPPYSPDLVPSDFHLFGPLKKHLSGCHFRTKVPEVVVTWLRDLNPDFSYAGFDRLVYRWNKCSTTMVTTWTSNIVTVSFYLCLSL
ncbi:hypothetical protein AVEN_22775-1 [Araneus ventricosus]|uniref:Histone-lysine N-methyltransferase SETMAR n=1 Tax=Araneus ventricosus TaxID=182803 RepID=A0A4Y2EEC6_ARAVE|nr:hypothetical protein AVEN_22775-1 [Araneus ventricosus]